ncbi:hypothetical protein LINPERHAP1_LOCUS4672 [Linum perenne]
MANEIVPIPMMEPLVVDLNNEVLQESNEWADRSCLVQIFWDHPVPLQAVRGMLDDVWKCRGELNIFEAGFGLYQFIFPLVQKRNWVLKTQPWSFELSIMNMIRKKVYEDKGKDKVSELEKEPKKLLLGNKGIVIRVLDEEASGERDSTSPKDQVQDTLKEMADIDCPMEERNHKEQVSDPKNGRTTLVKELFGMSGVEANKIWSDHESNEDDVSPWVSRIDTYGTDEGTIGEILREEEGLDKEG